MADRILSKNNSILNCLKKQISANSLFAKFRLFLISMARLIQQPKHEHLEYLRAAIATRFLRKVMNVQDCAQLAENIFEETKEQISPDTLRRLFLIIKSKSLPSSFTLNLCSRYAGFTGWQNLVESYAETSSLHQKYLVFSVIERDISTDEILLQLDQFEKKRELFETFNQIILAKVLSQDHLFFERIFEFKKIFEFDEDSKYEIYQTIHLLACLCDKHKWISEIAIEKYYNLPYEFDYFVEWMVVPEKQYYLPLLENYYRNKPQDSQAILFYNLIKCTVLAENNDLDSFQKYFKIVQNLVREKPVANNILAMRYFGVCLINEKLRQNQDGVNDIIDQIFASSFVREKDLGQRVTSILFVCQYLLSAGENKAVVSLCEKHASGQLMVLGFWGEVNMNQLSLIYASALSALGQNESATKAFAKVDSTRFDMNFSSLTRRLHEDLVSNAHLQSN